MSRLQPPVCPKDGHTVRVLVACRVSDPRPGKQDERSLDDQVVRATAFLNESLQHPFETTVVEGRESGENINRKDFLRLSELVATDVYDLLITEDLGRIVRRLHAHLFAEECVDHNTRLIALNDHVDTANEGWQDRSIFSAWHHERSNRDTSNRIKRSHANRFTQGGCAQFPIYGIVKPPGSKNDAEWRKDPAAEPIYQTIGQMLDEHGNYSAVADWLNEQKIEPGPYSRTSTWTGRMVARLVHNPILKGWRYRNKRKTRRSSDGRYRSIPADPSETQWRHVPHLAFFEPAAWDALIAKLDARNAAYSRGRRAAHGGRQIRGPRKRTRFPGQMTVCGICGRGYVFGGHGQKDHLMCDGARHYACWNAITFDSVLATRKIVQAVYDEIERLPEFDSTFLAIVNAEADRLDDARDAERHSLQSAIAKAESEVDHLTEFVATGGDSPRVRTRLTERERELSDLQAKLQLLENRPSNQIEIPSMETLKELARTELSGLPADSYQFQQLMQRLIPTIVVFPMMPCDGGQAVCRAQFRLHLGNIAHDSDQRNVLRQPLERVLAVDLFEVPQRVKHLAMIEELRRAMTERKAAEQIGITVTAVQKASALRRRMDALGLTDPYVPVTDPDVVPRLNRHRHLRYRFAPRPDAGQI